MNLLWVRSDLRVYDNPALFAALKSGPTVAVYCLTQTQWDTHGISPAKRSLIVRQVRSLAMALAQLNVPLRILNCGSFEMVPDQIDALVEEIGVSRLFFNIEYEVNEQQCEIQLVSRLTKQGVSHHRFHDQCIMAPGEILNGSGECYKVFSAFKRAFLKQFFERMRPLHSRPEPQQIIAVTSDLSVLDSICLEQKWEALWPAGEEGVHQRLDDFIENSIQAYGQQRDIPSVEGTSCLSPYLAVGALTTRQCLQVALSANRGEIDGGNVGISTWISELIWREFYRHLLVFYPDLCRYKPFKVETDLLPWKHDTDLFGRWCRGETGVPIVDAGMQQLLQTGWMHNRLRMVTAMYLTKDLFIDWRWGESYFMAHLVDGDLASNNGGWQWSASTGVDAVPYFRVFNPVRQSQRFDPSGAFIRHYLPQLRHLDDKSIHQPTAVQAIQAGYPLPMVDHRLAVEQVKAWFKGLAGVPFVSLDS